MSTGLGGNSIDLTRVIADGDAGVKIGIAKTINKDGWNATTLQLYSHSGTHMDAPKHFDVSEETIDQIPVSKFISKAWVVDVTQIGSSGLISVKDVEHLSNKISAGDSLLFKSGWSQFFGTAKFRDELPRVSKELAEWFGIKKIHMIGVEPPSVADVNSIKEVTEIHEVLMKNDVIIIEGLVNLEKIKKEFVTLIALPLKIKNGDGAPARVIAIEN